MTNAQVKADIAANLPDNTSGLITPAKLRTEMGNMVDYSDTSAAAAVAGHNADAGAHGLDATDTHSDATGINAGKPLIRLPYQRTIRGLSRDGSKDLSIAKISNWPNIDGGNLDILIIGDSRLTCVSFAAPIDCVGNNIIDVTDVGNVYGLYNTRLTQKSDNPSLKVGIASLGSSKQVMDRLLFDNMADVATGKFTNCNITVGLPGNLVSDGEFESAAPIDWSVDESTIATVSGGHVGKCLLVTNGSGGNAGLAYTTIKTTAGIEYTLNVWTKKGTAAQSKILVSAVGGGTLASLTGITDAVWTEHTLTFTATTSQTLVIVGVDDATAGCTALFDSISVMSVDGGGKITAKQLIATELLSLLGYQISFGANDSAGTGFRQLRVANT